MRSIVFVVSVVAAVAVGACKTTDQVAKVSKISEDEGRVGRYVVAHNCVIVQKRDDYVLNQRKIAGDVAINSLTYGEDGWVRFDFVALGVRDNVYYNYHSKRVVCGSRNWNKARLVFERTEKPAEAPPLIRNWDIAPSRTVELVPCRFDDDLVIGETPDRCRAVGGAVLDKDPR